jgi:hypothetical protein
MKTSEQISNIASALVKAQQAITFASKDAINPHLKSKYADLPSVIDAVKVALNSNGISFLQSAGAMVDMHMTLTTRLMHSSGEWLEDTISMPMVKQDPQSYGSALTYARRYSLAAITGLYQDDDDGYAASNHAKASAPKPKLKSMQRAAAAIRDKTHTIEQFRAEYDLTPEQDAELVAQVDL